MNDRTARGIKMLMQKAADHFENHSDPESLAKHKQRLAAPRGVSIPRIRTIRWKLGWARESEVNAKAMTKGREAAKRALLDVHAELDWIEGIRKDIDEKGVPADEKWHLTYPGEVAHFHRKFGAGAGLFFA